MEMKWFSTVELMERWRTGQERSILDVIENGSPVYEETPDVGLEPLDPAEVVDRYNFTKQKRFSPQFSRNWL